VEVLSNITVGVSEASVIAFSALSANTGHGNREGINLPLSAACLILSIFPFHPPAQCPQNGAPESPQSGISLLIHLL
jgi:hypothetical protein